jgi:hypothetical protein
MTRHYLSLQKNAWLGHCCSISTDSWFKKKKKKASTDAFLCHASRMLPNAETTYLNTRRTFGKHCCKVRTQSASWDSKKFYL